MLYASLGDAFVHGSGQTVSIRRSKENVFHQSDQCLAGSAGEPDEGKGLPNLPALGKRKG